MQVHALGLIAMWTPGSATRNGALNVKVEQDPLQRNDLPQQELDPAGMAPKSMRNPFKGMHMCTPKYGCHFVGELNNMRNPVGLP